MALYIQIPKDTKKNKAGNSCATMAAKAGYPRKRPGNFPTDVRGVQVRPERIAEHAKRNYYLGRLAPAFFPCAGALCLVRVQAARFRKRLFAVLRLLYRQTARSTAQAAKTPYRGKIQAQAA